LADPVLERLKRLHPKLIDLELGRTLRLLAALGHPEAKLPPVVHIAGTNGKGSTLAVLRAIAEAAGLSVHVYTSPHLVRFNERIRVAGGIIGESDLTAILEECERANQGQPITFFEVTTVAALVAFARTKADLCLLETGLGGRYDATNVVAKPALTLITPISYDHMDFLGDTLTAIAGEKAGILKPGVPCIAAAQSDDAARVLIAEADKLGAPLILGGRDWNAAPAAMGFTLDAGNGRRFDLPDPALRGAHQIGNAGLAAMAALALDGLFPGRIGSAKAIATGIESAEWPARMQRLTAGPLPDALPKGWELWLDGGHNPAAGMILADIARGWRDCPLDLIIGMLSTKDSAGFLVPFKGLVRSVRCVPIPGEANGLDPAVLTESARAAGLDAHPADSVAAALSDLARAPGPARVLICGSLYLAGTVLAGTG
jgi:dihydrofolate synthase/folylpolyglutamate synthase